MQSDNHHALFRMKGNSRAIKQLGTRLGLRDRSRLECGPIAQLARTTRLAFCRQRMIESMTAVVTRRLQCIAPHFNFKFMTHRASDIVGKGLREFD
jgi:hypothetical protein